MEDLDGTTVSPDEQEGRKFSLCMYYVACLKGVQDKSSGLHRESLGSIWNGATAIYVASYDLVEE